MPDWKQCEGEVAAGRFPLERYLGGNERTAVFLTRCPSGAAAIRIEPADHHQTSVLLDRWTRAAALQHPHLIGILSVGTWVWVGMPLAYLVMEYGEENLAEVLRDRPLTTDEAHQLLLPAAEALAYLHGRGLVHGNLKPANIFAVGDIVKISNESASPGDPADDIWALGTTVLQALTQREATVAPNVQDPAVDALPASLREVLQNCLAADPRLRWSADKIAASLRTPQPPAATPPAVAKPVTRKQRRWYYAAAFTVILAAAAVLGLRFIPRTAPPVPLASEPLRPLPASASPGATPSGPAPASEGAPPVPQADTTHPPTGTSPAQAATTPAQVGMRHPPDGTQTQAGATHPQAGTAQTENVVVAGQDEITRSVLPDISPRARNTVRGKIMVIVRVTVDSAGNVMEATVDPGGSPYFRRVVAEAVRGWQFAPAEGAVPRNWILRFEITRTGTQVITRRAKD